MIIKEYRIVLPCTVQEVLGDTVDDPRNLKVPTAGRVLFNMIMCLETYRVGQLYSVIQASKNETGGGDGVEVLQNEPYKRNGKEGQYTRKIYHLNKKVPPLIRTIAPKGALMVQEEAWNAYPYCQTILTNDYMKENFIIKIETWHKENDTGCLENVHCLCESQWKKTEIVNIDIAESVCCKEYKEKEDPTKFHSQKTQRGPLGPEWKRELANNPGCPHMCAYKLVTCDFKWKFLQSKVEDFIQKFEKRLFTHFHRQLFCTIDDWIDLTMDDIRTMEDEAKMELDNMRPGGEVKGQSAD